VYAINPTGEFPAVHQMNDLVVGRVDESLAFFHDRFLTVLRQSHDALSTTRVLPMLQRSAAPSKKTTWHRSESIRPRSGNFL